MSAPSSSISFRSWLVLISVGILIFLINIDYTAVNLTLLPISEEIDTDLNSLQWLLSAYVLVWAALVIPAGRVADLYGKRTTLIGGLLLFMLGSGITGLGHSLEMLIIGRILQGLGAALFSAPVWALIFTTASPEKQGFVMGIVLSFAGLGLATGPTLAGLIIEEANWRWIFYVNIPLGFIVIAILLLFAAKDVLPKVQQKIDYLGTFLLAAGLCLAIYAINQIEVWGGKSLELWSLILLSITSLSLYSLRDRKQKFRMIPPHFFKNKGSMATIIGVFFIAMTFSMVLVLMGLYLQNTLNYSSYETGLIFISMTISMGLLSPIGGKMIDAFGAKVPMVFGSLCSGAGVVLMVFLGTSSSLIHVVTALFLVGTGLGAYFTACNTAMMRAVPQEDLNVASGIYMMFMMIGNTLSVVLATSLVVLFGRIHLLNNILNQGITLTPEQHKDLIESISKVEHSASQLKDFPSEYIPQLLSWVNEAFVYGFSIYMMFGTVFTLIAAGLTLWGIQERKGGAATTAHAPLAL
jgi:EmrB/QacA subfamily drug resistance transporter